MLWYAALLSSSSSSSPFHEDPHDDVRELLQWERFQADAFQIHEQAQVVLITFYHYDQWGFLIIIRYRKRQNNLLNGRNNHNGDTMLPLKCIWMPLCWNNLYQIESSGMERNSRRRRWTPAWWAIRYHLTHHNHHHHRDHHHYLRSQDHDEN